MVSVRKRIGRTEEYLESKIIEGVKKAGATAEEAAKVVTDVGAKVEKMTVVEAEKLSDMVLESLRKVNKTAADAFLKFRGEKKKPKAKAERKGLGSRNK
jgi:transcriptional regulator NrdR family protein